MDSSVGVRIRDGLIVWCPVMEPVPGRIHDKTLAETITHVVERLEDWEVIVCDKGYQGMDGTIRPIKGRNSSNFLAYNAWIDGVRSVVERSIERIKRFRCLKFQWRHNLFDHPCAFRVCASLANLSIRRRGLRRDDGRVNIDE